MVTGDGGIAAAWKRDAARSHNGATTQSIMFSSVTPSIARVRSAGRHHRGPPAR